ncbi:SDR family NAD(P)-dependent oxidoreductase [Chitinophagaceae bacterium MMS25-I14]
MHETANPLHYRYIIRSREEALAQFSGRRRLTGLFLITEDDMGVARLLADELIYNGAFACIIEKEHCASEEGIREEIENARTLFGSVEGIIHLAGLKAMSMPVTLDDWHSEVTLQCKSLFYILKFCGEDLKHPAGNTFKKLVSCSLLGGFYGRDCCEQPGLPIAGSGQGLLRSLEYEWNYILSKTIDFDLSLTAADMTKIIVNELYLGSGRLEIGYPKGNRTIFYTSREPLETGIKPKGMIPGKRQVILATGGGRGITAETIKLLTNEYNQYIIVGRSRLLDRAEYKKYQGMSESQLRAAFIQEARAAGDALSPRAVESKIGRVLNDREIRENMAVLRRTGSYVKYVSCSVADEKAFGDLIDAIYEEFGKIDVVVHGAGVIDDYLLEDKTSTSFDKVFDTKVDSAFILYRKLKWNALRAFVLFTSTAGRYGNKGQSDYAAANELLNRFAWRIRTEWPQVLVKALNWGPWSGIGMATGVVNDQFIKKGIIPILPDEGTRFFIGELLHGNPGDVEVVLGEGTWNPDRQNRIKEIFDLNNLHTNFN